MPFYTPFLAMIGGYLLGTFPTAYFLVHLVDKKDIRREGTGNVGGMNAHEVSGKKWVGVAVALIDFAKGLLAVWFGMWLDSQTFLGAGTAGIFAVLGHNYNIFLGLKGGRGLATSAGILAVINPLPIVLWILMYLTGYYAIRRNIYVGTVAGSLGSSILIWNAPDLLMTKLTFIPLDDVMELKIFTILLAVLVIARNLQPLRDYLTQSSNL